MSVCFHLDRTIVKLSNDAFESEESINFWKGVLRSQPDPSHYRRFLKILANRKGWRVVSKCTEPEIVETRRTEGP